MQGHNGRPQNTKFPGRVPQPARVISMRAWKTRKRLHHLRGMRSWPQWVVVACALALAVASAGVAVASCIPFPWQAQCVIWTWVLALVGSVLALVMHVWRDRWAMRLLSVYVLCMTFSFVAGAVTLWARGH
ncbi:hypothetical protein [Alicyclobacillus macrosporangiidus]|uniref:hypothetical protein n=1 Tax=Alicyclobacillus macrosporangiidus TaxID=392015 RepID=UPI000496D123|nr:hypothetical protein [Alicyclobacillus macrosporangiidus]